jgi:hypothetical protein
LMGGISALEGPSLLNHIYVRRTWAASLVLPQSDWFNSVMRYGGSFVIPLAVLLSDL